MEQLVPDRVKITPVLVFFLIHGMQVGSGLLSFQRVIAKYAGYDAWIAVIIAGLSTHLILWLIYKIVEAVDGDLVSAHTFIFGNMLGKVINIVFIGYFLLVGTMVLRSYIEVVQVWIFPEIETVVLVIPLLLIVFYIVGGGFRIVTGVTFFGVIISLFIYVSILYTLKFSSFQNLLPIFDHSAKQLFLSGYQMSVSLIGFEALLMYYPYIKNPKESKKWAHLGLLATTILYTVFAILTFVYFSEAQLDASTWPTVTIWKIIQLPIVERFEYIGIAAWLALILPNICIMMWAASRMIRRTFPITQRNGLLIVTFICLLITPLFKTTTQGVFLREMTSHAGLIFIYGYVPLLFLIVSIVKRMKKT